MEKILPLCDDVAEWAARSWWRTFLACVFPKSCLAARLKAQLKTRSNTWGIGLWPDKETEDVAHGCAEGLDFGYACGSLNFIPEDSINLIAALDPTGDLNGCEAVLFIENEFNCTIPDSALSNCTFGELVTVVKKIQGTGKNSLRD